MREEAIEAVRHRQDTSGLEEDERDIIEFVRQLLQNNEVEQDPFDALEGRKGVRWLIELAATVGQYPGVVAAPDADQLPV